MSRMLCQYEIYYVALVFAKCIRRHINIIHNILRVAYLSIRLKARSVGHKTNYIFIYDKYVSFCNKSLFFLCCFRVFKNLSHKKNRKQFEERASGKKKVYNVHVNLHLLIRVKLHEPSFKLLVF